MIKSNIHINIIGISSFRNGLNHHLSSVSILRAKLWKIVMKRKNNAFLIFGSFFSKGTFLRLSHIFLLQFFPNQLNFSMVVRIHKIHVFEAFFLLATVPMVTGKVFFPVFMVTIVRKTNSFIKIMQLINTNYCIREILQSNR